MGIEDTENKRDNLIRLWNANPTTPEELQEAMSFLHGLCEEILLSRVEFKIEIWAKKISPTEHLLRIYQNS